MCRENRRDIKDEIQRIEYFQSYFGTNSNVAKAKQALKSIKGLETRKYKPRKYEELFENCVLKDKRLQREDICEAEHSNAISKQKIRNAPMFKDKDGEDTMIEERSYTPYIDCESLADTCDGNFAEVEEIMGVPDLSEVPKIQTVDSEQREKCRYWRISQIWLGKACG